MKREHVVTIFDAANITILTIVEISNQYWPDVTDYRELRASSPWFLVKTPHGVIMIGERKRVIEINWQLSNYPATDADKVTADDVTKGPGLIHAWSIQKAIEYLTKWQVLTI